MSPVSRRLSGRARDGNHQRLSANLAGTPRAPGAPFSASSRCGSRSSGEEAVINVASDKNNGGTNSDGIAAAPAAPAAPALPAADRIEFRIG